MNKKTNLCAAAQPIDQRAQGDRRGPTTITRSETRKVILTGIEEGHAIIAEHESYEINGTHKWSKDMISLTPDELRKILAITEAQS